MIRPLIAVLIIAGACNAYPYENESKLESPVENPTVLDNVPLTDDAPLPTEFPHEDLTTKGLHHEGTDLKTDATSFWWPYSYRPYYRYYRPRIYYRRYYW